MQVTSKFKNTKPSNHMKSIAIQNIQLFKILSNEDILWTIVLKIWKQSMEL